MLTLLSSLGVVGVATKTINELAEKELEYQVKYANCIKKHNNREYCEIKELPTVVKAVAGISLLIIAAAVFFYTKTRGR